MILDGSYRDSLLEILVSSRSFRFRSLRLYFFAPRHRFLYSESNSVGVHALYVSVSFFVALHFRFQRPISVELFLPNSRDKHFALFLCVETKVTQTGLKIASPFE